MEVIGGRRRANCGCVVNNRSVVCREILPVIPVAPVLTVIAARTVFAMKKFMRRTVGRANGPDRRCGPEIFGRESQVQVCCLVGCDCYVVLSQLTPLAQHVCR